MLSLWKIVMSVSCLFTFGPRILQAQYAQIDLEKLNMHPKIISDAVAVNMILEFYKS